jgi:hypothetical protein
MSKYSKYQKIKEKRTAGLHPVWRGIGCLMVIILPTLAYFSSLALLKIGLEKGWPIPRSLLGFVEFPKWVWKYHVTTNLLSPIANYPNFYAILVFTLVILILLSGIFSLLYSIMYRLVGPPQYSEVDAPPVKGRDLRKSR